MRANLIGFAIALISLGAFCWRGWPWRTYTVEHWFRSSFIILHIHYFAFYLLASVAAGFGATWLVRRVSPPRRVA